MERPSRDATFLAIATVLAARGTCDRKQVGALIVRNGRCVSWGYNGAPPGAPHCSENYHGYAEEVHDFYRRNEVRGYTREMAEKALPSLMRAEGCRNATHAEANALAFAARSGISTEGGTCYVTVSPCEVCARLLIAAGIEEVIYAEEYRDRRGIKLLTGAGIACLHGSRDGGTSGVER